MSNESDSSHVQASQLASLSPELRSDLLAFYLERNEEVTLWEAMGEFLCFVCRWTPNLVGVSTAVPLPDGWFAMSSSRDHERGTGPFPADFGRPDGTHSWARQEIRLPGGQSGWLAYWGRGEGSVPHLPLWGRMQEQLLRRYALAEMQHRYQALIDAAADAIITIDGHGTVLQFNAGAIRLFGYQPDEVIGQNVKLLMPPPHSQDHDAYLKRYERTGQKRILGSGRRVPARRKDGSVFPAHLAVTEFEQDGARHYIAILRDISDLVEARSRASVEERRHLSRELHDSVSQALFGISLGAQAIKQSARVTDSVLASADYILDLAESGLAEMRSLIFELRPEALESEGLLACLRKQARALAKRYRVDMTVGGLEREPTLHLVVKHELYRVLLEALHNVVKHARAAHCSVQFQKRPGEYRVIVRDDGCGFNTQAVTPDRVGFSSMRERLAQLGGSLRIVSSPGQGTTLKIRFPASEAR